jgi:hypothetical protein
MLKQNLKFIIKVMLIHVISYTVCGIIFSLLFKYQNSLVDTKHMRDMNNIIVQLSPVFQIFRGLLFGLVLLIIQNSILSKPYSCLKIWVILIIIGIFNTPATAPFSIEELIYYESSSLAWNLEFGGLLEILTQTFIFSFFVSKLVKPTSLS